MCPISYAKFQHDPSGRSEAIAKNSRGVASTPPPLHGRGLSNGCSVCETIKQQPKDCDNPAHTHLRRCAVSPFLFRWKIATTSAFSLQLYRVLRWSTHYQPITVLHWSTHYQPITALHLPDASEMDQRHRGGSKTTRNKKCPPATELLCHPAKLLSPSKTIKMDAPLTLARASRFS